jgi:hypothetical protein
MIPLITRRLSRGFTPRRFIGITLSMAANCSSVSQNRFDMGSLPHRGALDRRPRSPVNRKLGSDSRAGAPDSSRDCSA